VRIYFKITDKRYVNVCIYTYLYDGMTGCIAVSQILFNGCKYVNLFCYCHIFITVKVLRSCGSVAASSCSRLHCERQDEPSYFLRSFYKC